MDFNFLCLFGEMIIISYLVFFDICTSVGPRSVPE